MQRHTGSLVAHGIFMSTRDPANVLPGHYCARGLFSPFHSLLVHSPADLWQREGVPEAHHGRAQGEGLWLQHLQPALRLEGHVPRAHGHPQGEPARPQRAEVRLVPLRRAVFLEF